MAGIQQVRLAKATLQVSRDEYAAFWDSASAGQWEPETFAALARYLESGWSYIDAGSWMGPMALYGAALGAETFAFEPDPVAYARLRNNARLNPSLAGRLHTYNQAVSTSDGILTLFADARGNSETSVFSARERTTGLVLAPDSFKVEAIDLRKFMIDNVDRSRPLFLKMDIEGAEFDVFPHICEQLLSYPRMAVHISTHAFNIVTQNEDQQRSARLAAKHKIFDPLMHLNWHAWTGSDYQPADAQAVVNDRLQHPGFPDELLVTNF